MKAISLAFALGVSALLSLAAPNAQQVKAGYAPFAPTCFVLAWGYSRQLSDT